MGYYDRLADAIMKHSKLIVAVWIVVLVLSLYPAMNAFGNMSYSINDMGLDDSESMEGYAVIAEFFPSSDSDTDVSSLPMLVLTYDDEEQYEDVLEYVERLQAAVAAGEFDDELEDGTTQEKIASIVILPIDAEADDGSGIVILGFYYSDAWDGSVTSDTPTLREQIDAVIGDDAEEAGIGAYLTGTSAISYDMEEGAMSDLSSIDVFTILMVIILVGLFFRSFITSVTPPITIVFAFLVTMGIIYGITLITDVFFITEVLLVVSMFGAGCDYCIFIIARYREELRDGKDHDAALHSAIKWAGESISISGVAVIIGFGAMSLCSFSMVSMLGICLALGILIALLAALTLIPSILNITKDRIFWPTRVKEYQPGGKATKGYFAWFSRLGHKYFEKSSAFSIKHAKAIVVVAVIITVPAVYIAATTETSYDMTSSLMSGDSETGMDYLGEYADQGMIYPNYIVVEYEEPIATISSQTLSDGTTSYTLTWTDAWLEGGSQALDSMMAEVLAGDDNIATMYGPFMWDELVELALADAGYDSLEEIVESGDYAQLLMLVTDATDILDDVIQSASTSEILILEAALPAIEAEYGLLLDAGAFDEIFGGIDIPDELRENVIDTLVLFSAGGSLDYLVNYSLGLIGGDFVFSGEGTGNVYFIELTSTTHDAAMSQTSMDSISYMSTVLDSFAASNAGVAATWVTGSAAVMYDVSELITGEFNMIELLVIVLIIILLFFVMRSYTIPFRSVLTILMSICWTLAATFLIFDDVTWLVPLILLVICLGLGMDYDILLTTRVRENVKSRGMSNDEAIHHAVIHSGAVITICGLIMGGAFGTLMMSSMDMLQQFGFALCFAILVDALIVRTYIVPAVMHLLGDWNWKCPKFLLSKKEKEELEQKEQAGQQ